MQTKQNRIHHLFSKKNKNILSVFFTAGYPTLESTIEIAQALATAGVDLIEIGMPFSDPVADGPIIQNSSMRAIENGMNCGKLLDQVKKIRLQTEIPIILMGYLNPVLQYGMKAFISDCKNAGVDGVLLPDLPPEIFQNEYQVLFEKYGILNICMITPNTAIERIHYIDSISQGFLYLVSSSSTTGKAVAIKEETYNQIQELKILNPILIGFGIKDRKDFNTVCQTANGAIIGSAFIQLLSKNNYLKNIYPFIQSVIKNELYEYQ